MKKLKLSLVLLAVVVVATTPIGMSAESRSSRPATQDVVVDTGPDSLGESINWWVIDFIIRLLDAVKNNH